MSHKPQYTQQVEEHVEAWHHHTPDEGLPQVEHGAKPNSLILFIAFLSSVGFVGLTILATYLYFNAHTRDLRAEVVENTKLGAEARDYRDASHAKLASGYIWLNDDAARAGHVTLPLEIAKQRVIERYKK